MSRKSEREFVGGDMSDEEFAALNGDGPQDSIADAPHIEADEPQDAPLVADAPVGQPTAENAPPASAEPKMVDVRAVQEARAEKQRIFEEFTRYKAEEAERMARLDERMRLINEALQPKKEPPKVPDLMEEPLEHFDYRFKSVEEKLAAFEKAEKDRTEQQRVEQQYNAIIGEADAVLGAAMSQHPDLNDAFQFAANGLKQEIGRILSSQGISGQEYIARGNQMLRNEQIRLAQACPRDPDQAAEFVRRNARYWGWSGPQQAAAPAQAPAPAQVQQPTIQQRAEQQNRHMSLSGIPGSEPPKQLSAKDLAAMSEKQYTEMLKTVAGRKQLEEAFGSV